MGKSRFHGMKLKHTLSWRLDTALVIFMREQSKVLRDFYGIQLCTVVYC